MVDTLRIGLSALLAQQRTLAVTSNNIANASTPGYNRQRAELTQRVVEGSGSVSFGSGVDFNAVRRISDGFLADQLRAATAGFGRTNTFAELAASLDSLVADERTGLNISLQNFVNAVQQVADEPGSAAARQVLISEADNLGSRFRALDGRLREINNQVGNQITGTVTEINGLGVSIAELNQKILNSSGAGSRQAAPGLLDQRDQLLQRLSELITVETTTQSDGTLGVFIGSGQALVLGTNASEIGVVPGKFDPNQPQIVLKTSSGQTDIGDRLGGGQLGGLLDFRREMLAPLNSSLGQIAVGLATVANRVHRDGLDLNDQLGGDFFAVPPPVAGPASTNTGAGTVTATITDVTNLEPTSYELFFDGTNYTLLRTDNGAPVAFTGTGSAIDPFVANGVSIEIAGVPAAGDEFLIQPLEQVAGGFNTLISNPALLAAAAPTRTRTSLGNAGNAQISAGEVADVNDPNLFNTTTITFLGPATYSVNGAGAFAYTSGADIVISGSRVQISGAPVAGDEFTIEANFGGRGDNRNALRIIDRIEAGLFDGGVTSLQAIAGRLVTRVGIQTADASNQRDAQDILRNQVEQNLDSVRGVNLDEEAADLLRYEQLYQAAAQTITVANTLFDTLLAAVR